ncbi:family 20 glycosylhydrolase [Streptomyces sp. NPDC093085]|uniref:family 20 glycosylhydrolase n=1 Tax=Streptomyces sp. NPDC093085 TaxID=3155068 RepID=UPI00344AA933
MLTGATPAAAEPDSRAAAATPATVPALANWTAGSGEFVFSPATRILVAPDDPAARRTADTLADDLRAAGRPGVPVVAVRGAGRAGDILIATAPERAAPERAAPEQAAPERAKPERAGALGEEGYELQVDDRVRITGASAAGAFYGTRTLLQLLADPRSGPDRVPAGRTVDTPAYPERGVGVCACYIHITPEWLENLVRDMSYLKLNQLLLELKVKSDRHPEANTWGYYTKDEIRRLVALGERYHITIIPEINSPGHMDPWIEARPDLQLTDSDGAAQPSRLDVTTPEAFAYYTSRMDEYAEVFTAPEWHMGADEYMLGSDFAKYPHILQYARERYGPAATPQDAFIDFVNRVEAYAAAHGKRLRIWNDGLTGDHTVPVTPGTTIEHWLNVRTKPSELLAQGYPLMNASYALYLIRGGFHMNTASLYDQSWDPRSFEGEKVASAAGITGAKISLWPDNGRGETENEVAAGMFLPLRYIAQTTWGVPRPDPDYAAFTARAEALGHAPGYTDLTRPPLPDGTYTVRDAGGSGQLPALVRKIARTGDGYVTLADPATGRCAETRSGKLTLNTPLEPGSRVTQEVCSATNTLQRWQLTPVQGGFQLTNAITRMSVVATADGGWVQYPPDQRPPTVWTLTPADSSQKQQQEQQQQKGNHS